VWQGILLAEYRWCGVNRRPPSLLLPPTQGRDTNVTTG
jgi:hypothetical protein